MHDLAKVTRIQTISPIEGKDRIELATVENYNSIVSKGEFKPGDRCVYVFYDSILPEKEEFEFLRKRCWSEKHQGFRIRPIRLGGVVSEGLVLPMSVLPPGEYSDGQNVTDIIGIRLYEPPEDPVSYLSHRMPMREKIRRILLRHRLTRKLGHAIPRLCTDFPITYPKSDEENIEEAWEGLQGWRGPWYLTEKVEGQSATYVLNDGKLECYSQRMRVFDGSWVQFAEDNDLRKKMKKFCRKTGRTGLAIQGELCGPGIQKNVYKLTELRLFVFGMFEPSGTRMRFHDMCAFCADMGLETVPVVDEHVELPGTLEAILSGAEGQSVLNPDTPREGIVWRSENAPRHFKAKSRTYKVWFDMK